MTASVTMFAGPTLHRALAIAPTDAALTDGIDVVPPVRRGDVLELSKRPPGVAVVVDGYFHLDNLSVGHMELRMALRAGWEVWGLSSMGALRACEMREVGVKGWGKVYERYCADPDFRDDEVALLHEPEPPYREASEPLVHIRAGLDDLVARGDLARAAADALIGELMDMWFGDRTLPFVRDRLGEHVGHDAATAWARDFNRYRQKSLDLISFLTARPWRGAR